MIVCTFWYCKYVQRKVEPRMEPTGTLCERLCLKQHDLKADKDDVCWSRAKAKKKKNER